MANVRKTKSKKTPKPAKAKVAPRKRTLKREDLLTDIWPSEHDLMIRPDRIKYVRKIVRPSACVFCQAATQGVDIDTLVLFKGRYGMVIMNKYPYNSGHLLVLPVRHCGDLLSLSKDEHAEVSELVRKSVQALGKAYEPQGFNVGLNLGSASGAGIPEHLHFHVIPRWNGDTNFFPLVAETKVVLEPLEQTYDRLLPYFADIR